MTLNFQTYGSGPPLIILHGLFGMLDNWHSVSRLLGENFQVFALDQRNHGRSPHAADFTLEDMANDVRDFMHEHQIPRASLLGHSMGGKVAMLFAVRNPELLDKLIIVDIAPRAYDAHHDVILDALSSIDLKQFTSREEIDKGLAVSIPQPEIRQFLMKNLLREDDGSYRWKMNLPVIQANYEEVLKAIDIPQPIEAPTLFIRGNKSSYIGPGDIAEIQRSFPQSTILDFNAGHWVHAEVQSGFIAAVSDFLQ
jgi:esterase